MTNDLFLTLHEHCGADLFLLDCAETVEFFAKFWTTIRQYGHGEECSVNSAGLTNGKRRDGNSAGHLDCSQQRVETI